MKTIKLSLLMTFLAIGISTQAQVSINVNVGRPPVWAPSAPAEVQYYYLPDIEAYYDVPAQVYIYSNNGRWVRTAVLPPRFRGYDLYHGHTIYLDDYHGRTPYVFYNQHRIKYKGDKSWNNHDNGNHFFNGGKEKNEGNGNRGHDEGHGGGHGEGRGHGRK